MLKAGIPDIVTSDKGGTSITEIAEKTGMNADKLVRVMRLLTAMDVFTEVKDRYFRLTSVGKQYQAKAVLHPMHMTQFPPSAVSG